MFFSSFFTFVKTPPEGWGLVYHSCLRWFQIILYQRGGKGAGEKGRKIEVSPAPIRISYTSSSAPLLDFLVTSDLLEWFHKHKRTLPWREKRTPYRVWISEAMLQQTQVATVIPYFERWLKKFPTVQALAKASIDDVLKQWEGLGYYRRARNIHKAAQIIAFEKEGVFPTTYEDWLELPGIGSYTAAAISSIVNGEKVLVVDGNVKRVAARLFMIKGEVSEKEAKKRLEPFLPETKPGDFNEALMELGATICTPKNPKCLFCPVNEFCKAYQKGQVDKFPNPKPEKETPQRHRYALISIKDDAIWLRQRGESEMLSGLWGFVLVEEQPKGQPLPTVSHAYTHFRLTVTPVVTKIPKKIEGKFIPLAELDKYALSTLDYKVLEVIKPVT
jgi:A/G-specific adenine glycosylase